MWRARLGSVPIGLADLAGASRIQTGPPRAFGPSLREWNAGWLQTGVVRRMSSARAAGAPPVGERVRSLFIRPAPSSSDDVVTGYFLGDEAEVPALPPAAFDLLFPAAWAAAPAEPGAIAPVCIPESTIIVT
jgi:hypothetical protein